MRPTSPQMLGPYLLGSLTGRALRALLDLLLLALRHLRRALTKP